MEESSKKLGKILSKGIKFSTIFLVFFICCCTTKNDNTVILKIQKNHKLDSVEYGEIIYKSPIMDTIKLKEDDKRFLWFHFGIYNEPKNIEQLGELPKESFRAINDSVIAFESKFNKKGVYYFEGYIEETFLLSNFYKNGNMKTVKNKIKVSKEINVIK